MSFQKVKGMQDWYPAEKAVQRAVFDVLRTTALRFGFQEVEAPAIETLSLLTAKSGEEVKDQIFVLEKKVLKNLVYALISLCPLRECLCKNCKNFQNQ